MTKYSNRRNFLKGAAATAVLVGATQASAADGTAQEHYELRTYLTTNAESKAILERYLENALIPALGRMGIDRVGVFTKRDEPDDQSIFVLIPYSTMAAFSAVTPTLEADMTYQSAAKEYSSVPMDTPLYSRINSKFFKAFAGMPVMNLPEQSAGNQPRIFELRSYQGHTEEKTTTKIEMFNKGEIGIMQDAGMAPVFYGQAIIGDDVPNLTYMLSASDQAAHDAHWDAFRTHEDWLAIKDVPKYVGIISSIISTFLLPTAYSQI